MPDAPVIWHNPRCSKSRQTLALLNARGLAPTVVTYLDAPPTADRIRAVLAMLGVSAIGLMRRKEALFSALGLNDHLEDEDTLIAAMVAHPRLIERPVVIVGERAAIGRPIAQVLVLLD